MSSEHRSSDVPTIMLYDDDDDDDNCFLRIGTCAETSDSPKVDFLKQKVINLLCDCGCFNCFVFTSFLLFRPVFFLHSGFVLFITSSGDFFFTLFMSLGLFYRLCSIECDFNYCLFMCCWF